MCITPTTHYHVTPETTTFLEQTFSVSTTYPTATQPTNSLLPAIIGMYLPHTHRAQASVYTHETSTITDCELVLTFCFAAPCLGTVVLVLVLVVIVIVLLLCKRRHMRRHMRGK